MRVLIIHHLEKMWEHGYRKAGTSFDELAQKTLAHINRAKYDKVILTQFENWQAQEEHYESGLASVVDEWHDYGYGWEESYGTYGEDFTDGGNHSKYVMLDSWMWNLQNDKVKICGAFDGECIEDLEIALKACGVKFKRVEKLIV